MIWLYEVAATTKYPAFLLFALCLTAKKGDWALDFLLAGLVLWSCEAALYSMILEEL